MDFNKQQFEYLKRQINWWKLASVASLVIGIILLFVSIFVKWPAFLFTSIIGVLCIGFNFGYKIYEKRKNTLPKYQKVTKIKDDKEHVMCECIYCRQRMRLPNVKGVHGVTCPKCRTHFEVKI